HAGGSDDTVRMGRSIGAAAPDSPRDAFMRSLLNRASSRSAAVTSSQRKRIHARSFALQCTGFSTRRRAYCGYGSSTGAAEKGSKTVMANGETVPAPALPWQATRARGTLPRMRFLHTMLRVDDLNESLRFYCDVLGMRLLRRKDYPDGRFTLAFVGYGPE